MRSSHAPMRNAAMGTENGAYLARALLVITPLRMNTILMLYADCSSDEERKKVTETAVLKP